MTDRATAEQAWNTQKARAWAAGAGRLVKPINVPEMSVPAIERATKELRAALDAHLTPPPPTEVAPDKPAKAVRGLRVTAANERRG